MVDTTKGIVAAVHDDLSTRLTRKGHVKLRTVDEDADDVASKSGSSSGGQKTKKHKKAKKKMPKEKATVEQQEEGQLLELTAPASVGGITLIDAEDLMESASHGLTASAHQQDVAFVGKSDAFATSSLFSSKRTLATIFAHWPIDVWNPSSRGGPQPTRPVLKWLVVCVGVLGVGLLFLTGSDGDRGSFLGAFAVWGALPPSMPPTHPPHMPPTPPAPPREPPLPPPPQPPLLPQPPSPPPPRHPPTPPPLPPEVPLPSPPPTLPPLPPLPLPPASDGCPQRAGVHFFERTADFDADRECDCSWTQKWPCGASDASRCWNECCAHKTGPTTGGPLPPDYVAGGILKSNKPEAMIYYGYRAANGDKYSMENVNLANLEGVVMYLHHEVIWGSGNTRKFGIDRINRYRIAMKSTKAAFNAAGGPGWPRDVRPQFANFAAFDYGKIASNAGTLPSVGCSSTGIRHWGVYDKQAYGENVTYFSLPGKCYSRPIDSALHVKMPMTHGDYRGIDRTCVSRMTDGDARAAMTACLKGNAGRQMSDVAQGNGTSNQHGSHAFGRSLGDLASACNGGSTDPMYILCKDPQCEGQQPGGKCGNPPRGDYSCTFSIAEIGHIMLDDLEVSYRL